VASDKRIIFVSTMDAVPWGGSEELWSQASLDLMAEGFPVSAGIIEWSPLHPRIVDLRSRGVELWFRPKWYSLREHPWHWLASHRVGPTAYAIERLLAARPAALVVISSGSVFPPIELVELCASRRVPFVTIGQSNWEGDWFDDALGERYRVALAAALRCFFVSEGNRRLGEKQIGGRLTNAEIVRNPVNISYDASPPWPPLDSDDELRLACVAGLHWPKKGQDILFEALAGPAWQGRRWKLSLYGGGATRRTLERLARELGIADRVVFAGFTPVEEIWPHNHVLVMASRFEGLPLAMVEAMLCARPVVATNVAGHAEIIEDGVTGFLADAPTATAVAAALERFWQRRGEAEEMGKAGARRIRQLVPPDPARIFSKKLIKLAGLARHAPAIGRVA
jgi:glycosyltransferase involved in cell wall biosynthesis